MRTITLLAFFSFFSLFLQAQDNLPNIIVERMNGQKVGILEEVKSNGRDFTIINFWATWCKPCRNELENINGLYADWVEDYNVEMIAVSIDDSRTKAQIRPYVNGQNFDYKILIDENKLLFQAVNGITPPLTLIVNSEGKVLAIEHGYIEGNEYKLEDKLATLSKAKRK